MISIKEMACHTWALSGNPIAGVQVNKIYASLMDEIGKNYSYGEDLKDKGLAEIRSETMSKIQGICEGRKQKLDNTVYLCGGFKDNQVCPEHLWLENHTSGKTHDTFINQDVRRVDRVGVVGESFQPGCEAQPFTAANIARVQVDGYTKEQFDSLT